MPWAFADGNKNVEAIVSGPLIANDFLILLGAAVDGMGLAQVPEPTAQEAVKAGRLKRVLDPYLRRPRPACFSIIPAATR